MMEKSNLTMLTDFYEITMANGYFCTDMADNIACFDMFFRRIPDDGGYADHGRPGTGDRVSGKSGIYR